jgi:hypothetical protein
MRRTARRSRGSRTGLADLAVICSEETANRQPFATGIQACDHPVHEITAKNLLILAVFGLIADVNERIKQIQIPRKTFQDNRYHGIAAIFGFTWRPPFTRQPK